MNIGVDIDDTITDIKKEFYNSGFNYLKELGKPLPKTNKIIEDVKNDGSCYQKYFNFNDDEFMFFMRNIQEEIMNNAKPRDFAVQAINKLKAMGNKIIIITARDTVFHEDPYKLSKDWLDKNNIMYDKIVVNAKNKSIEIQNQKIDLFIDDSLTNCTASALLGIKTIRITNEIKKSFVNKNIVYFSNWKDIYNYIINL